MEKRETMQEKRLSLINSYWIYKTTGCNKKETVSEQEKPLENVKVELFFKKSIKELEGKVEKIF